MKLEYSAIILSFLCCVLGKIGVRALDVGDGVCITGYIMDNFCIELGYMLDNPSLRTLENPEAHSFHCLLDVSVCRDSGYQVLGEKNSTTGMHCLGFRFDDNDAVAAAGQAAGQEGFCSTCTGDSSKPEYGYRATVKGTVKELGDGTDGISGTPILENIEMLGADVECDVPTIPPLCSATGARQTNDVLESDFIPVTAETEEPFYGAPELSCPETLDDFVSIDEDSVLYFALVPSNPPGAGNGILCGRLEVKSESWISLGFSINAMMVGSEVIIGLPDDDTVLKYSLGGYSTESVTAMDGIKQTLRDSSIVQESGKTTMAFTKLLEEDGEIPILEQGRNIFLYARGSSNSLAYHAARGSFEQDFSKDSGATSLFETDENESDELSPSSSVSEPTIDVDCTKDFCESQLDDNLLQRYKVNLPDGTDLETCNQCTITMEVIYDGEAWVSIAFGKDGNMIGSDAVIGIPNLFGNVPQKYVMEGKTDSLVQPMPEAKQTLSDASVSVIDGQTIMKFTKIMEEEGEVHIKPGDNHFLWAYGYGFNLGLHAARGSYVQNLSTGASEVSVGPNKAAWLAHSIMGFIAWGVFVPFSVQASLFRGLLRKGPMWFHLHRVLNTVSYVLTVALFAIAVAYYNKEGASHFDGPHQKMGLAMMIMASVQVFGGLLRPHAPEAREQKKCVRSAWEIGHRAMGIILLACGFWQMIDGIELYGQKFSVKNENEKKIVVAYCVWIGLMSVLIVIGGLFSKLRKGNASTSCPDEADGANGKEEVPMEDKKVDGGV